MALWQKRTSILMNSFTKNALSSKELTHGWIALKYCSYALTRILTAGWLSTRWLSLSFYSEKSNPVKILNRFVVKELEKNKNLSENDIYIGSFSLKEIRESFLVISKP